MHIHLIATPTRESTAAAFANAAAGGWADWQPTDLVQTTLLPLAGEGLLASLEPLGFESRGPAWSLRQGLHVLDGSLILAAEASEGSTAPLGRAIIAATDAGASSVVVGLAPTKVHDGGRGLIAEMEAHFGSFEATRSALTDVELVLAASEGLPLLGLHGAGAAQAAALGQELAQQREREIAAWASEQERHHAPLDLTTGKSLRYTSMPGSGLGGGAGFALLLLGARYVAAHAWVAELAGLDTAIAAADLIVVVIETVDAATLAESALSIAGAAAAGEALPLVVIAGSENTSRISRAGAGVVGIYPVPPPYTPDSVAEIAKRVARTWSPRLAQ